jgi:hypothetical protein
MPFATVIDWKALGDVVVAALIAAPGLTIAFSLVIVGAARTTEAREAGHGTVAIVWGTVATIAFAAVAAAVAFGLHVMLTK